MTKWDNVEAKGFEHYSFEYDGYAQHEKSKLEKDGYDVKLLREKTDTKGLKMYSLWIKKGELK